MLSPGEYSGSDLQLINDVVRKGNNQPQAVSGLSDRVDGHIPQAFSTATKPSFVLYSKVQLILH